MGVSIAREGVLLATVAVPVATRDAQRTEALGPGILALVL